MKRQGPYLQYRMNDELPIPYTTIYYRNKKLRTTQNETSHGHCSNVDNGESQNNWETHERQENSAVDPQTNELLSDSESSTVCSDIDNDFPDNQETDEQKNNELWNNELIHDIEDQIDDEMQNDAADNVIQEVQQETQATLVTENEENEYSERMPIYPGASLTKEESDLLIMAFVIRFSLTDVAMDQLLELLNCHLPGPLNPSRYKFLQAFPTTITPKTYYKCSNCSSLLDFDNKKSVTCSSCHQLSLVHSVQRNGHSFVHVPLKDQLQKLLSSPLFHDLRRDPEDPEVLSDVTSGAVYKTLRRNDLISNMDISIQFNADEEQTFKSSRVSMCPIQVTINELEYRKRKDNILLAGFWASEEPPLLDLFLKPFIDELSDLHENGFECLPPGYEEPVTIKVHTILAPVDSKERCALQNIHQYNGINGCSLCLNEGERVPFGKGYTRVYRGTEYVMRTESQHTRDALTAEQEGKVVNGVKGVSLLMLVPLLSIILSFPPEYMHCVLLGVVKLLMSIWLDSKYEDKPWYMGKHVKMLDDRLLSIMPPFEVTLAPQSVLKLAIWKASEFRNFLLYYSLPCLRNILLVEYYKHWFLLVYSITLLNKNTINKVTIKMQQKH